MTEKTILGAYGVAAVLGICSTVGMPLGIYYAVMNSSLLAGLCSFFIPLYGFIYALIQWF